jgi:heat shock protein HslJ
VTGSGGCNRLTGSYDLNGDHVSFSKVASTRMACLGGMETAEAFLEALGIVSRWMIVGQQLELFDAGGTPLARFEAVHMK